MNVLRLIALIAGVAGLFYAAYRLALAVPPLWEPLVLIGAVIGLLTAVALLVTVPTAERFEAWGKAADFRRGRYYASLQRERLLRVRSRDELARADTDIVLLTRGKAEDDRTIAELTRDLNAAHAEIRNLRALNGGRRSGDRV